MSRSTHSAAALKFTLLVAFLCSFTLGQAQSGPQLFVAYQGTHLHNGKAIATNVIKDSTAWFRFELVNFGDATLTIGTPMLSGPDAGAFAVVSSPAASVLPQTSTAFAVSVQPSAVEVSNATLTFATNDALATTFTVQLQAVGCDSMSMLLLADIWPGSAGSGVKNFGVANNTLFFSADNNANVGQELWRTNGTAQGTYFLQNLDNPSSAHSNPNYFVEYRDRTYFATSGTVSGYPLWSTSGRTVSGAEWAIDGSTSVLAPGIFYAGDKLFYCGLGSVQNPGSAAFWATDATQAATLELADSSGNYIIRPDGSDAVVFQHGNLVLFMGNNGTHTGSSLYRSDGTSAGPWRLTPSHFTNFIQFTHIARGGGTAYVFLKDDGAGHTLLKTDGTAAAQVVPLPAIASTNLITAMSGMRDKMLFTVLDTLYATDGSGSTALTTGAGLGAPQYSGVLDGATYFARSTGGDLELWRTDGTVGGTYLVKDINPSGSSSPIWFAELNGELHFYASVSGSPQLWKTDGTEAGTVYVSGLPGGLGVYELAGYKGGLYFSATDGISGQELWKYGATLPLPEATVLGNGVEIVSGTQTTGYADSTRFGEVSVGATKRISFTIRCEAQNPATVLTINHIATEAIGNSSEQFRVVEPAPCSIASGDSATFTLEFSPDTVDDSWSLVTVMTNDTSELEYTFFVSGIGVGFPQLEVLGNSQPIAAGAGTPSATNGTDFGQAVTGTTAFLPLRYNNNGNGTLQVSSISITGPDAAHFVLPYTGAFNTNPSAFRPDTLTFAPQSAGTKTATVTIHSNDTANAAYSFAVSGVAVDEPEIKITGNGINIADGTTATSTSNGTNLGNVLVYDSTSQAFTIINVGADTLFVPSGVTLSGTHAADYSIVQQPANFVLPGDSSIFVVQVNPGAGSHRNATINVVNDDSDESLFNFGLTALSIDVPIVAVYGNGISISNGSSTPLTANHTQLGFALPYDTIYSSFSVANVGALPLSIGLPVNISGPDSAHFFVAVQPVASIAAQASDNLLIGFVRSTFGTSAATVSFTTNDTAATTFSFAIGALSVDSLLVLETMPASNSYHAAAATNIRVVLSQDSTDATVSASTVNVYSSQSGFHSCAISVSGDTILLDPATDFLPGETVTVSLTNSITTVAGSGSARDHRKLDRNLAVGIALKCSRFSK